MGTKGFFHLNADIQCLIAFESKPQTIMVGIYDDDYGSEYGEIMFQFSGEVPFLSNEVRFTGESFPLVFELGDLFEALTMYPSGIGVKEFKKLLKGLGYKDFTMYEEAK